MQKPYIEQSEHAKSFLAACYAKLKETNPDAAPKAGDMIKLTFGEFELPFHEVFARYEAYMDEQIEKKAKDLFMEKYHDSANDLSDVIYRATKQLEKALGLKEEE